MMVRQPQPLGRQAIQLRRADLLLPITPQIPVAEIIRDDEDDVRPVRLGGEHRPPQPPAEHQNDNHTNREHLRASVHRFQWGQRLGKKRPVWAM